MRRGPARCACEGRQDLRRAARARRRERRARAGRRSPPSSAPTAPARARCSASCRRWCRRRPASCAGAPRRWRAARSRARAIGYVGHEPGMYGDLSAAQNLILFAELYGLDRAAARARRRCSRAWAWARCRPTRRAHVLARHAAAAGAGARAAARAVAAAVRRAGVGAGSGGRGLAGDASSATERAAGRIVVLVTHDLDAAGAIAEHVVVLRRGRVAFDETRAARLRRRGGARDLHEERTRA